MPRAVRLLLLLVAWTLPLSPALGGDAVTAIATGRAGPGAIVLDGRLDEPAWQQAGVIADLTQRKPHPGAATPYHTRVLLLRDDHTLYIGVRAEDPDPAQLSTHTLVRDGDQTNDDGLTLVIDTVGSRRVAYVFQVNAAGAMADGLLSPTPAINSSNGVDYDWDGVWQAVTSRDSRGWTAEIAIDTRSLQFDASHDSWGFNLSRYVPRGLLSLNWAGLTLDSSVLNQQLEGELQGMAGMQQGAGWDFQPYGLEKWRSGTGATGKAGFDLSYHFTPSASGTLTYHTDFAEAEADQQQINTTRFPLFFPEKRSFFLEGSNLLSFGYNLGSNFVPYYSRTIGLVDGVPVPLEEGAKFLGQSESGSLAFLDAHTGEVAGVAQATDLFVGRGSYNVDPHLQVGALVTHGDPTGAGADSFMGADAVWKTADFADGKNLNLSAWGGRSSATPAAGSPGGYGVGVEYPNDLWYWDASYNQFGDGLDPALGFLPRPGTRRDFAEVEYGPRPGADSVFGWVNKFLWYAHYSETDGLGVQDGGKQSSEWYFSPALISTGDYYAELDAYRDTDAPRQAFQPAPGVTIPAGSYGWNQWRAAFHTPYQLPLVFNVSYAAGGYYGGRERDPYVQLSWTLPSGALQLSASHESVFGYLPQGDFITRLSTLSATWSFTPNLYVSTLAQYATGVPGVSLNTRLRWIVDGGSNIYLVWNRGLVEENNGLGQPVVTSGDEVILKVQWDFRS
jgi:hypothetical protein